MQKMLLYNQLRGSGMSEEKALEYLGWMRVLCYSGKSLGDFLVQNVLKIA